MRGELFAVRRVRCCTSQHGLITLPLWYIEYNKPQIGPPAQLPAAGNTKAKGPREAPEGVG